MVRHVDATHPSFDPSAAKAKFAGNFPDGIASFKESPDLVEDLLSDSLAVAAYQACPSDRIRTTIRACGKRRQRLIAAAAERSSFMSSAPVIFGRQPREGGRREVSRGCLVSRLPPAARLVTRDG